MSLEAELYNALKGVCDRTFPDVAPSGTARPYVTWQGIGGKPVNYVDDAIPDQRNTLIQVSVWSDSRLQSNDLIQQIEDVIRTVLAGRPVSQPDAAHEPDMGLYGAIQRFDIWSNR